MSSWRYTKPTPNAGFQPVGISRTDPAVARAAWMMQVRLREPVWFATADRQGWWRMRLGFTQRVDDAGRPIDEVRVEKVSTDALLDTCADLQDSQPGPGASEDALWLLLLENKAIVGTVEVLEQLLDELPVQWVCGSVDVAPDGLGIIFAPDEPSPRLRSPELLPPLTEIHRLLLLPLPERRSLLPEPAPEPSGAQLFAALQAEQPLTPDLLASNDWEQQPLGGVPVSSLRALLQQASPDGQRAALEAMGLPQEALWMVRYLLRLGDKPSSSVLPRSAIPLLESIDLKLAWGLKGLLRDPETLSALASHPGAPAEARQPLIQALAQCRLTSRGAIEAAIAQPVFSSAERRWMRRRLLAEGIWEEIPGWSITELKIWLDAGWLDPVTDLLLPLIHLKEGWGHQPAGRALIDTGRARLRGRQLPLLNPNVLMTWEIREMLYGLRGSDAAEKTT